MQGGSLAAVGNDVHNTMLTLSEAAHRLQWCKTERWSLFSLNSAAILSACSSIEPVCAPAAAAETMVANCRACHPSGVWKTHFERSFIDHSLSSDCG